MPPNTPSSGLASASWLAIGAVSGVFATLLYMKQTNSSRYRLAEAQERRKELPCMIILVRHGESEGNADHTLYRTKPDNLVELTPKGIEQAKQAGKRIEKILQEHEKTSCRKLNRLHLVVSPFERTLQTAATLRPCLEHRIVRTDVESRLREQEFGNLQGHDFADFRQVQQTVGRFWYRFPTGESGADVYDRVKSWWFESVLNVNNRVGYNPIDAMVVVTHGLTMRFALMQLYSWSPTTFHSVWNAGNCHVYVLRKDLRKPGLSPYVLDQDLGDMPRSSIDLKVDFYNGNTRVYKLEDYLSIPPPRTTRLDLIKAKLIEQYPDEIHDSEDIAQIQFLGKSIRNEKIGTTMAKNVTPSFLDDDEGDEDTGDTQMIRRTELLGLRRKAAPEVSCRFPNLGMLQLELEPDPTELALPRALLDDNNVRASESSWPKNILKSFFNKELK